MICKEIEPELICLHMVKCFQVLLSNTSNPIQHLNGFMYGSNRNI